jgi:Tfp pilus assembly protein PilF
LRDTHCQNCGTRLLLVVFPQSLQYDTNHVPSFYEDHLLERVSLLELRLVQMSESLRLATEIIREQGKIVRENQQQVKLLKKRLGGQGDKKTNALNAPPPNRFAQTIEKAVAEHDSPNGALFAKLLIEGVELLEKTEEKEAFRMLERAVLLSPRNLSLLFFIAKNYFFADKFAEAKKHLERAFELAPDNEDVLFLLGVICADAGETEKARLFLSILAENESTALIVNFIWGILAAFEENWTESVAAFKVAAAIEETAELQYLIGAAYFQQKDDAAALRYLKDAVSVDRKYCDAWFMQAVIYRIQNDERRVANMLETAAEIREAGAQCAEFIQKNNLHLKTALPFQYLKRENSRLLTGAAPRLVRFLKSQITKVFE